MIDKDTFLISDFTGVKGLVFFGEQILVFRRDTKTKNFPLKVDLPGGGKENNETPFETFAREVEEEFGLTVQREDVIYSKKYPSIFDDTKIAFFVVTKSNTHKKADVIFGDEGLEFFYTTPEEYILLTDGIPQQQIKVKDFLEATHPLATITR
ncbi:MAG: NUDIX domain-containing protein [Candidatus Pacebacteria bacterium]|nr:NUDIX domain-containing protein [Candidatus Paceibacterota bacterium]